MMVYHARRPLNQGVIASPLHSCWRVAWCRADSAMIAKPKHSPDTICH
jgi:hypothetical protein